jgi:2-polyprenyl-6-methoxyphenol hydroxylase-like FAD-dependent oxidoreductase
MKILIIGGGIGGFSVYHALRKHLPTNTTSIKIYESYTSAKAAKQNVGGGLKLSPNGMRALAALNGNNNIIEYITKRGFAGAAFTLRNSHGTLLGHNSSGVDVDKYKYDQMLLPRAVVHDAVMMGVSPEDVHWDMRAKKVHEKPDGKVEVVFEDGSVESADLVIGADGVRSVVREAIFGDKYIAEYEYVRSSLSPFPPADVYRKQRTHRRWWFPTRNFPPQTPARQPRTRACDAHFRATRIFWLRSLFIPHGGYRQAAYNVVVHLGSFPCTKQTRFARGHPLGAPHAPR